MHGNVGRNSDWCGLGSGRFPLFFHLRLYTHKFQDGAIRGFFRGNLHHRFLRGRLVLCGLLDLCASLVAGKAAAQRNQAIDLRAGKFRENHQGIDRQRLALFTRIRVEDGSNRTCRTDGNQEDRRMRGGFELVQHVAVFLQRIRAGVNVTGRFADFAKGIVLIEGHDQRAQGVLRKRGSKSVSRSAPRRSAPHVENGSAHAPS